MQFVTSRKLIILNSLPLIIGEEIEITYDDKEDKVFYNGHTSPCLDDYGFGESTIIPLYDFLKTYVSYFHYTP